MRKARPRLILFAWCLYDWACSAFNTVVSTFIIATYFVRSVAVDPTTGTAQWAMTQAAAGLLIALLAAPLGAIADRGGRRRSMLAGFTLVMALATAGLWFVRPVATDVALALALVATATVAYEIATVFYNAMLPDVAAPDWIGPDWSGPDRIGPKRIGPGRIGKVSGVAWAAGYAGGIVCLTLCLVLLIAPNPALFGLDRAAAQPVRATALFAAAWLLLFGWPVMLAMPDGGPRRAPRPPWRTALREGLAALGGTLRRAAAQPGLIRFLLARMLYNDGLTTLFAFGAIFAAGTFHMDAQQVLLLGIALNVTAGIGALAFAFLEDRIGAKATVLTALACLTVLGLLVLLARDAATFWALALGLGVFVGPAQAASRSLMARIAPADDRNAQFGLYALSGRVTGFLGPAALGAITAATHSQRAGMAVIVALLAGGGMLLATTRLVGGGGRRAG